MKKKRKWLGNVLTAVDHVTYHVLERIAVPQGIISQAVLQVVLTLAKIFVQEIVQLPVI